MLDQPKQDSSYKIKSNRFTIFVLLEMGKAQMQREKAIEIKIMKHAKEQVDRRKIYIE